MTMDKSSRGWSWLLLTILSSIFFCVTGTSLCVVRHYSGDEFVNEGGATSSCSVYGASCAAGSSLVAGEGRCGCDINEAPRPCPACKCNSIYPVFNGTQCFGWRGVGWRLGRDDITQPTLNYNQLLAVHTVFSYPTKVYGWKVRLRNRRTEGGWLLFQVWRPKIGGFELVGSTNFSYDPSLGEGYMNTEIPLQSSEEIRVDQGDIFGLFLPSGVWGAPFVLGTDATASDSSDLLLFTIPSDQDPPNELRTTHYDEHISQYVMNIRAMIGPVIEGEKVCIYHPETNTVGTATPSQNSNSHLDIDYIQMIVAPLLLILLFFIFLGIGVGVAIPCIRLCLSSRRKKKRQEAKVVASLDSLRRTSVFNIYPPNPVPATCPPVWPIPFSVQVPKPGSGNTNSCCTESIYETIPELGLETVASRSGSGGGSGETGSLPHTYAVLERPLPKPCESENSHCELMDLQVHEKVQNSLYKSQKKRPSIKDELTGQESEKEQDKVSEVGGVARDNTEQFSSVDGGMNDETNQEVFEFNADSDCDLQIYKV